MSLGFEAYAKLVDEDENMALYLYSGSNWNEPGYTSKEALLYDGELLIYKSSLEEPEIHEKIKKMPSNKKKLVVKRITHIVGVDEKIKNGEIVISPCKAEKLKTRGCEYFFARKVLHSIYEEYQKDGCLPKRVGYMV